MGGLARSRCRLKGLPGIGESCQEAEHKTTSASTTCYAQRPCPLARPAPAIWKYILDSLAGDQALVGGRVCLSLTCRPLPIEADSEYAPEKQPRYFLHRRAACRYMFFPPPLLGNCPPFLAGLWVALLQPAPLYIAPLTRSPSVSTIDRWGLGSLSRHLPSGEAASCCAAVLPKTVAGASEPPLSLPRLPACASVRRSISFAFRVRAPLTRSSPQCCHEGY